MSEIGGPILLLGGLTGISLFLSLHTLALHKYSIMKLQEAFKAANREDRFEEFLLVADRLAITCSFLRLLANTGILLILF